MGAGEDPQLSTKDPWRKRRSEGTTFRCPSVVLGGWSDPYAIYYFQWSFPLLDHVAHDAADRCAVHANETEPRPPVTTPGSVASVSGFADTGSATRWPCRARQRGDAHPPLQVTVLPRQDRI